jgi:hypothetical protein
VRGPARHSRPAHGHGLTHSDGLSDRFGANRNVQDAGLRPFPRSLRLLCHGEREEASPLASRSLQCRRPPRSRRTKSSHAVVIVGVSRGNCGRTRSVTRAGSATVTTVGAITCADARYSRRLSRSCPGRHCLPAEAHALSDQPVVGICLGTACTRACRSPPLAFRAFREFRRRRQGARATTKAGPAGLREQGQRARGL